MSSRPVSGHTQLDARSEPGATFTLKNAIITVPAVAYTP